ncbi:hypothetical protein SDC9_160114 [bioreactor metagenome]|uniref:Uncharacterized protein n=1 Tax=bioreactor metagenome TaxID=1076179 RepID=A0A645FK40_9ZZZZ
MPPVPNIAMFFPLISSISNCLAQPLFSVCFSNTRACLYTSNKRIITNSAIGMSKTPRLLQYFIPFSFILSIGTLSVPTIVACINFKFLKSFISLLLNASRFTITSHLSSSSVKGIFSSSWKRILYPSLDMDSFCSKLYLNRPVKTKLVIKSPLTIFI